MLFYSAPVYGEGPPRLVKEEAGFRLRYQLEVPEDGGFWSSLQDAIRAGKKVSVTHYVDMREANVFFGGKVAQASAEKYVSYNLFENTYSYGTTLGDMRQTTQLDRIKNFLFSVDKPAFVAPDELETATLYEIRIRVHLDENPEAGSFFGIDGLFSPKLRREFSHVAR